MTALAAEMDGQLGIRLSGAAVTGKDGAYAIRFPNVSAPTTVIVKYEFLTEGGDNWEQPEEAVAEFELRPGDELQLDFSVDAPITIPVMFADVNGAPLEGIAAGLRAAGTTYFCGGMLLSNAEGKVTFHGVAPFARLQAVALKGGKVIGVSEAFAGEPGEVVPGVVVVCHTFGGIEGIAVDADGSPVANTTLNFAVRAEEGLLSKGGTTTNDSGAFGILEHFPEGIHPEILLECQENGRVMRASIPDVEIVADFVTDVGAVVLVPQHALGGIEGIAVNVDGNPVANTTLNYAIRLEDGSLSHGEGATTDASGVFSILDRFPAGTHSEVFLACKLSSGLIEGTILLNVEIAADTATDVGTVVLAMKEEELMTLIQSWQ